MVKFIIVAVSILLLIEIYSIGVLFLVKKTGENDYLKCLIPFYSFKKVNELTGVFKILTIPVVKYMSMMIELVTITLIAVLYGCWGDKHLVGTKYVSHGPLWQIMGVVIGLMALITFISLLSSSKKIARRFNIQNEGFFTLCCLPVITIPIAYVYASKNQPKKESEMY